MVSAAPTENPQAERQWALVERVLGSSPFRRTTRLRDFLRYVAAKSVDHAGTAVPEQEIGTAVFGRPPDYDTGIDNIVRVSAGDLRRRLEHYFLNEGAGESVICQMPRGGYTLLFQERAASEIALEAELPSPALPLEVPTAGPTGFVDASVPDVAAQSTGRTGFAAWLGDPRTLGLLAVCLLLATGYGYAVSHPTQDPWQGTLPLRSVWTPFLSPGTETEVILADSSFALIRSLTRTAVSLPDYLDYRYREAARSPHLDASTQVLLDAVLSRNMGSVGDFEAARGILALSRHPAQLVLGSAHDFTPAVVKSSNVILLGGSQSNPWVDLYHGQRTLLIEQDPSESAAVVRNLDVRPGETAVYRLDHGNDVSGYAVLAILPNIDPDKRVMILEGTDSQATQAASNFITSETGAAALAKALQGRPMPRHVEVLLRSSKLLATALEASIVTVHTRDQ